MSDARGLGALKLPLEDIRILSLEQYGAGPFGSLQLADLGADVIRVEGGEGDVARAVAPFSIEGDSLFYQSFNRNKRTIDLDLSSQGGREIFSDLVRASDAVYSNLRGDVVAKLGLKYADLAHLNPKIVCCSLSGYGLTGPRVNEPAYDYMIQAVTGWMMLTGEPDGIPTKSGLSVVDFSAGIAAAAAMLAGIHAARRDGVGGDCDLSLFDTAMSMLNYVGTWQATSDYAIGRQSRSAHPTMAPFQAFKTLDGWIVAGGTKEKFWRSMAIALGREELLRDPRFASFPKRLDNRSELIAELDKSFAVRTTSDWESILSSMGVPCGRVNTVAEALAEPQAAARGTVIEIEHPEFGVVRTIASAVRVGSGVVNHRRAPKMGEQSLEVLHEVLGYDTDRIEAAVLEGFVRLPRDESESEK